MWPSQAFLLLSLTVSSLALHIPLNAAGERQLSSRASNICGGNADFAQCGGNFPTDFCCHTGSSCFGFNGNQSVVCCPAGQNCNLISVVSCDPSLYNASAVPTSPIHMSNLSTSAYTPCGSSGSCCPAGYVCNNGGCVIENLSAKTTSASGSSGANTATTASVPSSTQTLFPITSSASSKPSSFPSSSGASAAAVTNNPTSATNSSGPQFPIEAILVGLFPGLAAGCIICFLIVCCIGRRRNRNKLASDSSSSLGPTMAKISDPIYTPNQSATRTDFLRQQSTRIAKKASQSLLGRGNTNESPVGDSSISRMRSLFRKTSHSPMTPDHTGQWSRNPTHLNHLSEHSMPDPGAAAERALHDRIARSDTISTNGGPRTPRREPSMESIPIYNNTPDARGYERNTVFADLLPAVSMRSADPAFQNNHGRKPSGGLMPPMFLGSPLETGR